MTSFATDDVDPRVRRRARSRRAAPSSPSSSRCASSRTASCSATTTGSRRSYAPGHGDLFPRAARLGHARDAARERGVRHRHRLERRQPRRAGRPRGDRRARARAGSRSPSRSRAKAGRPRRRARPRRRTAPARSRGRASRPDFDQELVPVFNTNTAVFDLDALDRDFDLTWLYVEKTAEGRAAVQLERVYHEASRVPRRRRTSRCRGAARAGASSRSRRPEDLERRRRTTSASCSPRHSSDTRTGTESYPP